MTLTHPRDSSGLTGHKAAEARLLESWARRRVPHALLLTGPKGVGKATLAYRFARFLLAGGESGAGGGGASLFGPAEASLDMEESHPVFRRVSAGSHPDLLAVEPGYDERKKARRQDIVVEDTRKVKEFLSLTPAESAWRVVIIDSADAMNLNAANALLKILEEPPRQSVLLLVCHHAGALLPTIRSRCQRVAMGNLDEPEFGKVFKRIVPGVSAGETEVLRILSGGAPGVAAELHEHRGLQLYEGLIAALEAQDFSVTEAFAGGFSKGEGQERWALLERILRQVLAALITLRAEGATPHPLPFRGAELLPRLAAERPLDDWLELWDNAGALLADATRIHLDRKLVVLNILQEMQGRRAA